MGATLRVQSRWTVDLDASDGWFEVVVRFENSDWVDRSHHFIGVEDGNRCVAHLFRWDQFKIGLAMSKTGEPAARGFMQIGRPWLASKVKEAGFVVDEPASE